MLDPSLPADHSPLDSGEMRGQFQAIQNRFDDAAQVQQLGLTVSNPPTQAEDGAGPAESTLLRKAGKISHSGLASLAVTMP
jgi:hypothetical protein